MSLVEVPFGDLIRESNMVEKGFLLTDLEASTVGRRVNELNPRAAPRLEAFIILVVKLPRIIDQV